MKKIIIILTFSPRHDNLLKNFSSLDQYTDYYKRNVGGLDYLDIDEPLKRIFFYKAEFQHVLSIETLKRTTEFEIEFWRPYHGIAKDYSKNVDGVLHRVFPGYKKKLPGMSSYIKSPLMNDLLKEEIKKGNVLLSLAGPTKTTTELLLDIKPKTIPVLVNHRSGTLVYYHYKNANLSAKFNPIYLIEYFKEIYCFRKYIDIFQCTIRSIREYIQNNNICRTVNLFDGIDYSYYQPAKDIEVLKRELGIDPDKKILLYVGRFYRDKDVDFLIRTYLNIKKKRNDIILLMVGGYKSDEFYQMGVDAGAIMVERIPQEILIKYHQIADIFISPVRNYIVKNFGGIGSAPIQSFACGVPFISDNLIHFQGGEDEVNKVGRLLINEDEMIKNITYIIDNKSEFSNCREISRKYYDVDVCTQKLINIYNELFGQYYGKN